jgi:hypothetical protein
MSSLHQAHNDIGAMLEERDELSRSLTLLKSEREDVAHAFLTWLGEEKARSSRSIDMLRREVGDLEESRAKLQRALAPLGTRNAK